MRFFPLTFRSHLADMELVAQFLTLLVFVYGVRGSVAVSSLDNDTSSSVRENTLQNKTSEIFDYGSENRKYSVILPGTESKKSPRGFAVYEGYYDDKHNARLGKDRNDWSPYQVAGHSDTIPDGTSNVRWNVQRKTESRQGPAIDEFQFPGFNQDYSDMVMMMQFMKKMDEAQRPGLLSRILDNPTALVMVTFIPVSLLIVATLPLLRNLMTNGVQIPPLISTTAGKARKFPDSGIEEITLPILRNLADFGSRYLENPDCLHRIFCEMVRENATETSPNYLRRAFDTAAFVANGTIIGNFGMESLIDAVKTGKCDKLACATADDSSRLKLIKLMDDVMYKRSRSTKPKKR